MSCPRVSKAVMVPRGGTSGSIETHNAEVLAEVRDVVNRMAVILDQLADVLRVTPLSVDELPVSATDGDTRYCTNGNHGTKCLVTFDGTNWRVSSAFTTGDIASAT